MFGLAYSLLPSGLCRMKRDRVVKEHKPVRKFGLKDMPGDKFMSSILLCPMIGLMPSLWWIPIHVSWSKHLQ